MLTDRYIYSLMVRAMVRGLDPEWIRNIYSFALKPDAVFYLRIGVDELIPRVVFSARLRLLGIRNGYLLHRRYV